MLEFTVRFEHFPGRFTVLTGNVKLEENPNTGNLDIKYLTQFYVGVRCNMRDCFLQSLKLQLNQLLKEGKL